MTTLFGKVTPAFIYHITLLVENSHVIGIRNIMCLCDGPDKENQNTRKGTCETFTPQVQKKKKKTLLVLVTAFSFRRVILFDFDEIWKQSKSRFDATGNKTGSGLW